MGDSEREQLVTAAEGSPDLEGTTEREGRRRNFVAALRSGKFRQTRNVLCRQGVGHCCLGVACEVAIEGGAELKRRSQGRDSVVTYEASAHDTEATALPQAVMAWFGFDASNPLLRVPREVMEQAPNGLHEHWHEDGRFRAAGLNDDWQLSFELIADCFEYTFLPEDWQARHGG